MEQTEIDDLNQRITRLETMHMYGAAILSVVLVIFVASKYLKKND